MKNESEERITLTKPLTRKDWRFLLVSSLLWVVALSLLLPFLGLLNGALDSVRVKAFGAHLCPCEDKHKFSQEDLESIREILERAGVDFKAENRKENRAENRGKIEARTINK